MPLLHLDNNNEAKDPADLKWKKRFYLLLGIVAGQLLGRLFVLFSGQTAPAIFVGVSFLWLSFLFWAFWINLRKKRALPAAVIGFAILFFGAGLFFVALRGFPDRLF